jgi:hypothetical protein
MTDLSFYPYWCGVGSGVVLIWIGRRLGPRCHGMTRTLLVTPLDLSKGPSSIANARGLPIVMVVALATSRSTSSNYCLA